jgi:hypothetical protein
VRDSSYLPSVEHQSRKRQSPLRLLFDQVDYECYLTIIAPIATIREVLDEWLRCSRSLGADVAFEHREININRGPKLFSYFFVSWIAQWNEWDGVASKFGAQACFE